MTWAKQIWWNSDVRFECTWREISISYHDMRVFAIKLYADKYCKIHNEVCKLTSQIEAWIWNFMLLRVRSVICCPLRSYLMWSHSGTSQFKVMASWFRWWTARKKLSSQLWKMVFSKYCMFNKYFSVLHFFFKMLNDRRMNKVSDRS